MDGWVGGCAGKPSGNLGNKNVEKLGKHLKNIKEHITNHMFSQIYLGASNIP